MSVNKMINGELVTLADRVQYSMMPTPSVDILGKIVEYTGATNSYHTHGYYYECVPVIESGALTYVWKNISIQDSERIQVETLPDAGVNELGNIYEYVGATTDLLVNGYFYQCVEIPNTDPAEYTWTVKAVMKSIQVNNLPEASYSEYQNIYQYVGATDYSRGMVKGYFYKCVSDEQDPPTYSWEKIPVQDSEKTQYETMPIAGSDNVGQIVQYIGTTTATYTKGFFYRSVEVADTDPTEYEWINQEVQEAVPPNYIGDKSTFDSYSQSVKESFGLVCFTDD